MSPSSGLITFTHDITRAVNSVRRGLLGRSLPSVLYHYTRFDKVLKIGDSRTLWATCAADLDDKKEIDHGAEIVQAEVQRKVRSGVTEFSQMVLEHLRSALFDCKRWTFVACFCAKRDSRFHRKKYGEYCLGFKTRSSWEPQLRPRGLDADFQYYRAIYWRYKQRETIRRAIDSIADSAARNAVQGRWMPSFTRLYAQNASQLLMDLIVSFKVRRFRREKEWRIVCRPNLALNSLDPDVERGGFKHLVKVGTARYVELHTPAPNRGPLISGHPPSAVPFDSIYRPDGFRRDEDEQRLIRQMLTENCRTDIQLG
jgi:hypothetical protein